MRSTAVALPSASAISAAFSASAAKMRDSLSASARKIFACFSPSATRILLFFSPSARKIASLLSRSARICFSIASWISFGGRMFFSSTRLILIPQGSVASSRMIRILELTVSRDVKVSSSSNSPTILRSVVAVRFSMAERGLSTP